MSSKSASSKTSGKKKTLLENTLGHAPPCDKEDTLETDLSHLKKPLVTSIYGLKQVMALFKTGTKEVQDYITYECDVLYECRICRSIFRSLANFILHKRNYCKDKCKRHEGNGGLNGPIFSDITPDLNPGNKLSPIIDNLVKKQELVQLSREVLNEDLTPLTRAKIQSSERELQKINEDRLLVMEEINTSECAVFQTLTSDSDDPLIKSQIMEIYDKEEAGPVLGPDGKICTGAKRLSCIECAFTSITKDSLIHHIRTKHNRSSLTYPCSKCSDTFENVWGLLRHLYKVHQVTSSQVKRMRATIHSSGVRRDQIQPPKENRSAVTTNVKGWIENLDMEQICGGCGKKFERRAALNSHSQTCVKRLAAIASGSSSNSGSSKQKVPVSTTTSSGKLSPSVVLKGSAKRKATLNRSKNRLIDFGSCGNGTSMASFKDNPKPQDDADVVNLSSPDNETPQQDGVLTKFSCLPPDIEILTISDDDETPDNQASVAAKKRKLSGSSVTVSSVPSRSRKKIKIPSVFSDFLSGPEDEFFFVQASRHMDIANQKCVPCNTDFVSPHQLLWHMSLHFSWFRFQCGKCNFCSFNEFDCISHAHQTHGTPNDLIGATVLPIPKWKVLCTFHDFKQEIKRQNLDFQGKKCDAVMPVLEPELDIVEPQIHTFCLDNDLVDANDVIETIILEDEDDVESETKNSSDDDSKMGGKKKSEDSLAVNRPVRNRMKSVKTVQNDFIYDLAMRGVKLNDVPTKSGKIKKPVTK